MTYEQVQHLKPEAFKRLCGVRPETFAEMVTVLEEKARHKRKPGRPSKLSIPNQVLMTLQKGARISHVFSHGSIVGGR